MLEDIRVFVKVLQLRSFTQAAKALSLPTSTVSRSVAKLEEETGTRLILRTTRSINPTAAGLRFYENCLEAVQTLEEARTQLNGTDALTQGTVRLTAPEDIGEAILSSVIGSLTRSHPGLSFEVDYTDRVIDLVQEGFDLAIRLGKLKSSRMTVKRVGKVNLILVASPAYLEANGAVKRPEDLSQKSCLCLNRPQMRKTWNLKNGSKSLSIAVNPRVTSNQMTSLITMAIQSAGIAFVPSFLCHAQLRTGRLVQVLPEWKGEEVPVSLVVSQGKAKSARLKLVSDRLAKEITRRLS